MEGAVADPRRSTGSAWLVALTLAVSVLGAGAWYGWRLHTRPKVAELSIEEYLRIKHLLEEVRIEGDDLNGAFGQGAWVFNNQLYKRIHVTLPPGYATNARNLDELKSGVDPSKFHRSPGR